jgi:uncharacterized SAM-binding protein YcdF (DUF218 family)
VRLIAVLGYSNGGSSLHRLCAERLRRAEAEAAPGDVVLLSGWARRGSARSEAELMRDGWRGPAVELILSGEARSTAGNARTAAEAAIGIGATEVVLVTSVWHERRAAALFRAALRGTGIRLAVASAESPSASTARLRELACWLLVPAQAALVRNRSRSV